MQSGLDFETWETTNLNRAPLNRKRGAPHPRRVLVFAARVGIVPPLHRSLRPLIASHEAGETLRSALALHQLELSVFEDQFADYSPHPASLKT
jgi:hypothetical protein